MPSLPASSRAGAARAKANRGRGWASRTACDRKESRRCRSQIVPPPYGEGERSPQVDGGVGAPETGPAPPTRDARSPSPCGGGTRSPVLDISPESPEARRKRLAKAKATFGTIRGRFQKGSRTREVIKRVAIGVYSDGFIHAGNLAFLAL